MEIKNRTLYDRDLIIKYNHYYLMDFLKKNSLFVVLAACGFGAYLIIKGEWKYAFVMVGIIAMYFILAIGMQLLTTKRVLKKSPIVSNPVYQTYIFREDELEIYNVKAKFIKYVDIIRVKESKDFLIIYDVEKRTYIVDKNGFEEEEGLDKIKEHLKNILKKKFH